MIITIHNEDTAKDEYCVLEFQAELVEAGIRLGDISFRGKRATLRTSTHAWEGNIEDLKTPFAILEKKPRQAKDESAMESEGKETGNKMLIAGFVKKKILFKTRPKPMKPKT